MSIPIIFFDDVTPESIQEVISQLEEAKKKKGIVELRINSPGGDLDAAFGLIDYLYSYPKEVHGYVCGLVGSCAVDILQACDKRYSGPYARFLVHKHSVEGAHIKMDEHKDFSTMMDMSNAVRVELYVKATGHTRKSVTSNVLKTGDHWFRAKEALKFGLIDAITEKVIKEDNDEILKVQHSQTRQRNSIQLQTPKRGQRRLRLRRHHHGG